MINFFVKTELWEKHNRKLFAFLFVALVVLGIVYLYFMNLAVLKTVERNANLVGLTDIKRVIQDLEGIYIAKIDKLNIDHAKLIGFIESEPSLYIYREKSVAQGNSYGSEIR